MAQSPTRAGFDRWLSLYAKLVVAAAFFLIFVGGHTTTSGAGMAFPDWPLSHGSVNPAGWWENVMQRLEHGHRLTAEFVGLLVGILCAWVWRSRWAVPGALVISAACGGLAMLAGMPPRIIAHIGLWSSAVAFACWLILATRHDQSRRPGPVRWLAFAAFVGVLAQAVLGGLRVTIEAGGDARLATAFRVVHGCFAQIELCLLVTLAALLSPVLAQIQRPAGARGVAWFGWMTATVVFVQLIVGATMRHLNAGLAIPTFPRLPDGGWVLKAHGVFMDLNFTHTRFGALAVLVFVTIFVVRSLRMSNGEAHLARPAWLLLALLVVQITAGMFVIWKMRPPMLTTLHVVNGAALLATTVLLSVRWASSSGSVPGHSPASLQPVEVSA